MGGKRKQPAHVTPETISQLLLHPNIRAKDRDACGALKTVVFFEKKHPKRLNPSIESLEYHKHLLMDAVMHNRSNIWRKDTLKQALKIWDSSLGGVMAKVPGDIYDDDGAKLLLLFQKLIC